jgi:hypothetical protein
MGKLSNKAKLGEAMTALRTVPGASHLNAREALSNLYKPMFSVERPLAM